jgi:hypothetical protein
MSVVGFSYYGIYHVDTFLLLIVRFLSKQPHRYVIFNVKKWTNSPELLIPQQRNWNRKIVISPQWKIFNCNLVLLKTASGSLDFKILKTVPGILVFPSGFPNFIIPDLRFLCASLYNLKFCIDIHTYHEYGPTLLQALYSFVLLS